MGIWTDKKLDYIKANRSKMTFGEMAFRLQLTKGQVAGKVFRLQQKENTNSSSDSTDYVRG